MNKITNITRLSIQEILINGIVDFSYLPKSIKLTYYGKIGEVNFLKRLFDLSVIPCKYISFRNFEEEIKECTGHLSYIEGWIFNDDRFGLMKSSDSDYLKFICEIFHPEVRMDEDRSVLDKFYHRINSFLKKDGFELYIDHYISGRPVFNYRILCEKEITSFQFVPFSMRYDKEIRSRIIKISISKQIRSAILDVIIRFSENEMQWDESEEMICSDFTYNHLVRRMNELYDLYYYDKNNIKTRPQSLENIIMGSPPYKVFDAIELFSLYLNEFSYFFNEINRNLRFLGWCIKSNKIMELDIKDANLSKPKNEERLKDLIKNAEDLFNSNVLEEQQLGLEKLWDAFERVKSYFYPNMDKKKSIEKVINLISSENKDITLIINTEFRTLTDIGNNFSIRHFEKGQNDLPNIWLKRYFFNRCSALLNLTVEILNKYENNINTENMKN